MIAAKVAPSPARNPRTAAYATERRRVHTHRSRYRGLLRIGSVLSVVVLGLLLYVTLTANVTGLNYGIGQAERERAQLTDEVQRLDDRIAHLESRERLSLVAAKLGMRES
ncbi:MAG: hypothetical protein JOY59_05715, partial [Candidatus Eremiobacteraeota bacterium]|nr:hypothetical protein [Candidatus Eremiobacteraeota bacterium]